MGKSYLGAGEEAGPGPAEQNQDENQPRDDPRLGHREMVVGKRMPRLRLKREGTELGLCRQEREGTREEGGIAEVGDRKAERTESVGSEEQTPLTTIQHKGTPKARKSATGF